MSTIPETADAVAALREEYQADTKALNQEFNDAHRDMDAERQKIVQRISDISTAHRHKSLARERKFNEDMLALTGVNPEDVW